MKTALNLPILCAAIAAAACTACANDAPSPPPAPEAQSKPTASPPPSKFSPESRFANLTKTLGLSVEQQAKLQDILREEEKALVKLKSWHFTEQEYRERVREIFNQSFDQTAAILTPTQKEKLDTMRPRGGNPKPQQPPRSREASADPQYGQPPPQRSQ